MHDASADSLARTRKFAANPKVCAASTAGTARALVPSSVQVTFTIESLRYFNEVLCSIGSCHHARSGAQATPGDSFLNAKRSTRFHVLTTMVNNPPEPSRMQACVTPRMLRTLFFCIRNHERDS